MGGDDLEVRPDGPEPGGIGGSLAYDYGFNVETSGDHPRLAQVGDRRLPRAERLKTPPRGASAGRHS